MLSAAVGEYMGIQQQLHVEMEYLAPTSVAQRIQVKICLPSFIIAEHPGCVTVICEECHTSSAEHQVCDAAPMQEMQWCANARTIQGMEKLKNSKFDFAVL